jgi:uncharacterized protein YdeI (YjbR/CyaY-like superfamily)
MKLILHPRMPRDVVDALGRVQGLLNVFKNMRPSRRTNYILWITAAKKDEVRRRRVEGMVDQVKTYGQRHNMIAG